MWRSLKAQIKGIPYENKCANTSMTYVPKKLVLAAYKSQFSRKHFPYIYMSNMERKKNRLLAINDLNLLRLDG